MSWLVTTSLCFCYAALAWRRTECKSRQQASAWWEQAAIFRWKYPPFFYFAMQQKCVVMLNLRLWQKLQKQKYLRVIDLLSTVKIWNGAHNLVGWIRSSSLLPLSPQSCLPCISKEKTSRDQCLEKGKRSKGESAFFSSKLLRGKGIKYWGFLNQDHSSNQKLCFMCLLGI